jgi:preprotein translocase subunit Sss1
MEDLKSFAQSAKNFAVDSERFLNRCDKPDRKGINSFI